MAQEEPVIVHEHDVYTLSSKGEEELRGSETSLSPAEIELLVRVDGRHTVEEVGQGMRLLAPDAIVAAVTKLVTDGMVRLKFGARSAVIPDLFTRTTTPTTSRALARARAQAATDVTTLQKNGYFVRIAKRAAKAAPFGGTLSVVVVEDEPLLARFLKQYLSFDGFDVRLAANRSEVVAAFREPPLPALVLLDVMLPDVDGFDILAKIRSHAALKDVPVIMMTAKATREAVIKGLAGGANGYVTKPFEADALLKAVKTVLGLPRDRKPATQANDAWNFS